MFSAVCELTLSTCIVWWKCYAKWLFRCLEFLYLVLCTMDWQRAPVYWLLTMRSWKWMASRWLAKHWTRWLTWWWQTLPTWSSRSNRSTSAWHWHPSVGRPCAGRPSTGRRRLLLRISPTTQPRHLTVNSRWQRVVMMRRTRFRITCRTTMLMAIV